MTNTLPPPPEIVEPKELVGAIKRSFHHAYRVHSAAHAVATNFRWFYVNELRPILLLDFDVICGALPGLAVRHRLQQREEVEDVLSIAPLWGPSLLRVLLQRIDDFAVPPGTAAELFTGLERLNTRLSERAGSFVRRIRGALQVDDPSKILTGIEHSSRRDILLEDLTRFEQDVQDHSILQGLLSRAVPTDELLPKVRRASGEAQAFRGHYYFLSGKRPAHSVNNLHDALNATLVVSLFNNPIKDRRRVPVLISDTRAIRELNAVSHSYLRPLELLRDQLILFNNSLFLIIGQGLLERTQGRFGVAADEAGRIADESLSIANGCLELLNECTALVKKGKREEELTLTDLTEADIDLLYYRVERFNHKWGNMLAPADEAAGRDRLDYLRFLLSPQMRSVLSSNDPAALKRASQLTEKLMLSRPTNVSLWELLLRHGQTEPSTNTCLNIEARAFEYHVAENDGTLLRQVRSTVPLASASTIMLADDHNFRVVVSPAYVSGGVAFSVASFRRHNISPNRYLSFTWLHSQDAATIIRAIRKILFNAAPLADRLRLMLFTDDCVTDRSSSPQDIDEHINSICERVWLKEFGMERLEFFRLEAGTVSVFADLQFLDGSEMQANLTINANLWSQGLYAALLETAAATCELPITTSYLRKVLEPVWSVLEIEVH